MRKVGTKAEAERETHTHTLTHTHIEKESNSIYSISMWKAKLIRAGNILNVHIWRTVFRMTQHCHGGVFRVTHVRFRGGMCLILHH